MGRILKFGRPPSGRGRQVRSRRLPLAVAAAIVVGSALGYLAFPEDQTEGLRGALFSICDQRPHRDCVIDGDTFYMGSQPIRIADIDTPETHPPRCAHEAELGARATDRLLELLNAGPFTMEAAGGRDEDQYGRKLRIVVRDGRSIGNVLVSEGLAREWTGRRLPWCE